MVIVGDGECGKTCLVTRMSTGNFVDIGYIPTVFETEVVSVNTGSEDVELVIFDTAGQEDYDRLRPFSYTDVDVALICFSLADQDTLTNVVENWYPEIRYFCGNVPIILVGNKKDIRDAESSRSSSNASIDVEREVEQDAQSVEDRGETEIYADTSSLKVSKLASLTTRKIAEIVLNETKDCRNESNSENPRNSTISTLYAPYSKPIFRACAPIKHSEGVLTAKRIGAMAYFETSALTGDNVEELLLATAKAAVLGTKKSRKFKPFTNTMASWKSLNALSSKR
ncbi:GTP-binding protein rhoa [Plakobranchus ocellatus]|uniref:GTP-binding protein rhoa n=1 Tax=Plakobranchus ocellatus TaxID=259542 RepID=A0AAV4AD51_9GAST|nr:GTP-binding protein rhoa [Plakobranchus ocellatus]